MESVQVSASNSVMSRSGLSSRVHFGAGVESWRFPKTLKGKGRARVVERRGARRKRERSIVRRGRGGPNKDRW